MGCFSSSPEPAAIQDAVSDSKQRASGAIKRADDTALLEGSHTGCSGDNLSSTPRKPTPMLEDAAECSLPATQPSHCLDSLSPQDLWRTSIVGANQEAGAMATDAESTFQLTLSLSLFQPPEEPVRCLLPVPNKSATSPRVLLPDRPPQLKRPSHPHTM